MGYVGEAYKYDVFFSYAYAEKAAGETDDFKRWTRRLIDGIRRPVALAMNGREPGKFSYYLDRDHIAPGAKLNETLQMACESSAIMVMFLSPHYMRQEWCRKELEWFLAAARKDGRNLDGCVVVEIQKLPQEMWPMDLRDSAGNPVLYHPFTGDDGLPISYVKFCTDDAVQGWGEPVSGIVSDIINKLDALRSRRAATDAYRTARPVAPDPWPLGDHTKPLMHAEPADLARSTVKPQPPNAGATPGPESLESEPPTVFFEAEEADYAVWRKRRPAIEEKAAMVLPADKGRWMQLPGRDILELYKDCDGLVLLRNRPDDGIKGRLKGAYRDWKELLAEQRSLNVVVLNEQRDAIPMATALGIEVVATNDDAWPDRLIQALRPGTQARAS